MRECFCCCMDACKRVCLCECMRELVDRATHESGGQSAQAVRHLCRHSYMSDSRQLW